MNMSRLIAACVTASLACAGCEMAPGTYTTMGTGSDENSGQPGQPEANATTSTRAVATPVLHSATTHRSPGHLTMDPVGTSLIGATAARQDQAITLHSGNGPQHSSNAAINLYGEVLAKSMTPRSGDPTNKSGGSNLTQVSFAMEGADFDPDVSPDGRRLVYASTQHRLTSDIYVKSTDSRVVSQLTNDPANDVMPRISPDGTRVAFASNRAGNWDIYVMPINGGRAIQLTNNSADDLHPTWSPNGNKLAFCRLGEVSDQWEIWTCDVGNAGVASFVCYGLFPNWCPVANTGAGGTDKIAFQKSRERGDRAFGIWTIDYKEGQADNLTEIASTPLAACINPSWSLDGQWLAFATVPNPQEWARSTDTRPTSSDLWLVDISGSSRISLSAGTAVNLMPTWGPNNRLFFVSDRGGVDNIWSMDTTQVVQLAAMSMKNNPAPYVAHPVQGEPKPFEVQTPGGTITTGQDTTPPGERPH